MTTWWHQQRLAAVRAVLDRHAPASLIDLGSGTGDLLIPLAEEGRIARLAGLEPDAARNARAEARRAALDAAARDRVSFTTGSLFDPPPGLRGFAAAVMVEVIEHLDPGRLSAMERAVLGQLDPGLLVLTTPNAEFNTLLGVPPGRFRHPDHRFEWGRARFRAWAAGVAQRWRREVCCHDIGGAHPDLGGASQMAVFVKAPATT